MKSLIYFLIVLFLNSVYAHAAFVYNDHGKRDPFVPLVSSAGMLVTYDQDLAVNDLVLEGIVADASDNNVALVNGKLVKAHDQIGPYMVDSIGTDQVAFVKGAERFILRLKKEVAPSYFLV